MIPKMSENCAGEIDITIGLDVDGVIFVMWLIILPYPKCIWIIFEQNTSYKIRKT